MDKKIKLCIFVIGLLDFVFAGFFMLLAVSWFLLPLIPFIRGEFVHSILIIMVLPAIIVTIVVIRPICVYLISTGVKTLKLKEDARSLNIMIHSIALFGAVLLGIFNLILVSDMLIFHRLIFLIPIVIFGLILIFLNQPKVKEVFEGY